MNSATNAPMNGARLSGDPLNSPVLAGADTAFTVDAVDVF
jgi:hypothetical protein